MFRPDNLIGLDFETYARVSLPDVGLARYVNDEYFEPTLASIAWPDGSETTLEFPGEQVSTLQRMLRGYTISAHNAGFESAVLKWMDITPTLPLIDSAVVAAVAGADRHLAGAAQQLMNTDKLDEDRSLLRLFAMRQEGQLNPEFDRQLTVHHPRKWEDYKKYCERDARLSRGIVVDWLGDPVLFEREMRFAQITLDMNERGWPVDVAAVKVMQERYLQNLDEIQDEFARKYGADLNLASHAQVKKWCADRGVRSSSFDKQHIERMVNRLLKLRNTKGLTNEQAEVLELLIVKQELGGSSLKKLETILATAHEGRVYDQYVHAGAPQSLRTSGRSIQMQNLPRLAHQRDMDSLHWWGTHWTNDELAGNLRQVFRSAHPQGQLLVADFASIESRGLGYLAGETWKVEAYRRGEDVYKAQAVKIFKLNSIDDVDKEQRTTGKVGELSCGYGAGPVAVRDFAAKMHVELSESEAGKLVRDWRDANPHTVDLWDRLGAGLFEAVEKTVVSTVHCAHGVTVKFKPGQTPASLLDQAPNVQSIRMEMWKGGRKLMARIFHGCYLAGRDIRYHKPSSLKGGKPWEPKYTDPKTKRQVYYKLYGGKITGILVQSMCREIFFEALTYIEDRLTACDNAQLIGQFHDEVVVDWHPGAWSMVQVMTLMKEEMTQSLTFPELPMGVEVKHDYRYTK